MKTISLLDIKEKLNELYNNCDKLDTYHIDTKSLRDEIVSIDTLCDSFSDENLLTNTNVKVQGNAKELYNRFIVLESNIKQSMDSIKIFTSVEKINKSIKQEELNPILEEILNDLMNYVGSGLHLNEFSNILDKFYTLIKLEYKYTGHSHIENYFKNTMPDKSYICKIYQMMITECSSYEQNDDFKNLVYSLEERYYSDILLLLSIFEDGYLDEVKKELLKYKGDYFNLEEDYESLNSKIKEKKTNNRHNKVQKAKLFSRFIPVLLSITTLISANILFKDSINEHSQEYNTTTEMYDTLDGWSRTSTYQNLTLGDTTITVYNPVHSNGARVIKTYKFVDEDFDTSDIENYNFENMAFNSSEYKYDEHANSKSSDRFITMKRVSNINYDDSRINNLMKVAFHILVSVPIVIIDLFVGAFDNGFEYVKTNVVTLTLLIAKLDEYMNYIKDQIDHINAYYKFSNMKIDKNELKELDKKLKNLNKEYTLAYEKYSHLNRILNECGYSRKLTRRII